MALKSGTSRTVRTPTGQRVPIPSGDPTSAGYAAQYAAYSAAASPEQMARVSPPTDEKGISILPTITPTNEKGYTYKGTVYPTREAVQLAIKQTQYEQVTKGFGTYGKYYEVGGELQKAGVYSFNVGGVSKSPSEFVEAKGKKSSTSAWQQQKVQETLPTTEVWYNKPYVGDVSKGSVYYEIQHPSLEINIPTKPLSITESLLFGYGYTQQKAISGAGFVLGKAYEYETYPSKYLGGKSSKFGFTNWTSFGEAFDIGEAKYSRLFQTYYEKGKTSKGVVKYGYYSAAGGMLAGETVVGFGGVIAKHPVSTVLGFKAITMLPVGLQLGTFGGLTAYEVYKSERPLKTLAQEAVLLGIFVGGGKTVEKLFYKPKIKGTTITSETFEQIRTEEISIYDVRAKTKTYLELGGKKKELEFKIGGRATRTLVESSEAFMGKKNVVIKLNTKAGEVWLGTSEKEAGKVLGLLDSGERISFGEANYVIGGKTGAPLGYGATFDITALTEKGDWAKTISGGAVSVKRGKTSLLFGEEISHKFLEIEKPFISITGGKVLKESKVKVWYLTPEEEARLMIKTGKLLYVREQSWIKNYGKRKGGRLWGQAWTMGTGKGKLGNVPIIKLRKDLPSGFKRNLFLFKSYFQQIWEEKKIIALTKSRLFGALEYMKHYNPTRKEVLAHEILHVKNPTFSEKTIRELYPIYAKTGFEHIKVKRTAEVDITGTPSGTYSFWESIGYSRIQKKGEKNFFTLGKHVVVTMIPEAEVPTELGGVSTVLKAKTSFKTPPLSIKQMVSKVTEKELVVSSVVPPSPLLKFKPSYSQYSLKEEYAVVEIPSTKLRMKEFLEVESKVKSIQRISTRLRNDVKVKTDLGLRNVPMLRSHMGLDTETQLRTDTRLVNELKTESRVRTVTEMVVPIVPPPIIKFPLGVDVLLPKGRGGKFRPPKFRPKYTPSLLAGMFGIRGKQPRMITGLEVRPLPLSKRRRKRR